ncbi:MAG: DUF4339 domain-containing protein, partial [Geobacter sp.]|nr:DUF4339 domain-containing protein [Geobacter sp.]
EVTDLARRYGIVTPYTAFLIVEDEAARNVPVASRSLQVIDGDAGAMGGMFAGQSQPQQAAAPTPGAVPPPLPPQLQLFVALNGQQSGPLDLPALQQLAQSGQLTRETLVWKQGMASWAAASTVTELAVVFGAVPPPLPQ